MRTNKFIPILLALAIHLLPLSYFLLKRPKPIQEMSQTPTAPRGVNGIDLSGFSLARPSKSAMSKTSLNSSKTLGHSSQLSTSGDSGSTEASAGAYQGASSGGNSGIAFRKYLEPPYPPVAREKGYQGTVKIKLNYNQTGDIEKIEIIQSSGYKMLDEAVKKTASEWKLSVSSSGNFEKSFEFKLKN